MLFVDFSTIAILTGVAVTAVFIPIPKKGNARECSNYHTIALMSHTSKVMLKILQARFHLVQLEHLEVHGSRIAEAWLGEF